MCTENIPSGDPKVSLNQRSLRDDEVLESPEYRHLCPQLHTKYCTSVTLYGVPCSGRQSPCLPREKLRQEKQDGEIRGNQVVLVFNVSKTRTRNARPLGKAFSCTAPLPTNNSNNNPFILEIDSPYPKVVGFCRDFLLSYTTDKVVAQPTTDRGQANKPSVRGGCFCSGEICHWQCGICSGSREARGGTGTVAVGATSRASLAAGGSDR